MGSNCNKIGPGAGAERAPLGLADNIYFIILHPRLGWVAKLGRARLNDMFAMPDQASLLKILHAVVRANRFVDIQLMNRISFHSMFGNNHLTLRSVRLLDVQYEGTSDKGRQTEITTDWVVILLLPFSLWKTLRKNASVASCSSIHKIADPSSQGVEIVDA